METVTGLVYIIQCQQNISNIKKDFQGCTYRGLPDHPFCPSMPAHGHLQWPWHARSCHKLYPPAFEQVDSFMGSSSLLGISTLKGEDPWQQRQVWVAQIDGAVLPLHRGGYHPPPCCGFQSGQTQQFLTATARMKQKTQIVFICLQTVFAGHRFVSFPCCSPGAAHENSCAPFSFPSSLAG